MVTVVPGKAWRICSAHSATKGGVQFGLTVGGAGSGHEFFAAEFQLVAEAVGRVVIVM